VGFKVQRNTLGASLDTTDGVVRSGIIGEIIYIWKQTRIFVFIPILKCLVTICLVMSLLLFIERVYMSIVVVFVKLLRRTPEKVHKWEPINDDDLELANTNYPMVLIQIPMYNEKEVCQLSIGAACRLSWPLDRMIVQVLDDSTDPASKVLCSIFFPPKIFGLYV
jgi:beta-mannan synthase